MSAPRIAVVTGANKGIGFEIVRTLAAQTPTLKILLCSRCEENGRIALNEVKTTTNDVEMRQLDISVKSSVRAFCQSIKADFGGIDILVNNAAIAFKNAATEPFGQQAKETLNVNYFGTVDTTEALLPLIRKGGRIVTVSSGIGTLSKVGSDSLRAELDSEDLTVARLTEIVQNFVEVAQNGTEAAKDKGFPPSAYGMSKVATSAYTRIVARQQRKKEESEGVKAEDRILVNAVCPGWCRTDMAGDKAPRTAEKGAETPAWLALLPPNGPHHHGKFFRDKQEIEW